MAPLDLLIGGFPATHRERAGRQAAEWAEAGDTEEGEEKQRSGTRVESCVTVAGVQTTETEKETSRISSLVKVASKKQQILTSEEVPIRVYIWSVSCAINTSDVPGQQLSHPGLC